MESEGQGPSPLDWHSLFPWTPWSMRPHRPGAEASPLQTGTRELGIGAHVPAASPVHQGQAATSPEANGGSCPFGEPVKRGGKGF